MNNDYQKISNVINYLSENSRLQPSLEELAEICELSPYHFQRLFRRWAGVSPKQFLQYITVQHARALLESSAPILDTCFEVGLSGPGRLHDHFVQIEAVTPGDVKRCGDGLTITCGIVDSPFGPMFSALSERGVCALEFLGEQAFDEVFAKLRKKWPGATVLRDDQLAKDRLSKLFSSQYRQQEFKLLVQGTNFQVQVWRALLNIPDGRLCSYGRLAAYIGKPDASRAVASAVGANPVAYLIPCHRVLRAGGALGGYRWGQDRKQSILAWEASRPPIFAGSERQLPLAATD